MIINVGPQINCSNKNFDPKNVIKKGGWKKLANCICLKKSAIKNVLQWMLALKYLVQKKLNAKNVGSK